MIVGIIVAVAVCVGTTDTMMAFDSTISAIAVFVGTIDATTPIYDYIT